MQLGGVSTLGCCVPNEVGSHFDAQQVFSTIFLTPI
jgi:hypothetical protein